MKHIIAVCLLYTLSFSNPIDLTSFMADFNQTITDDKGEVLAYSGSIKAQKPQFALWSYKTPVEKKVYMSNNRIVIIEPEIEQVIIRGIKGDFDFFSMIQNAKKIDKDNFVASFEESKFYIKMKNSKVSTLSYKDKFDNDVKIVFTQQIQNSEISPEVFKVSYPLDYDVIRD